MYPKFWEENLENFLKKRVHLENTEFVFSEQNKALVGVVIFTRKKYELLTLTLSTRIVKK